MKKFEVERPNCVYGLWEVPYPGGELVNPVDMIEHHISQNAGQPVTIDQLSAYGFHFEYGNPSEAGQHGVMGTLYIHYDPKQPLEPKAE